MGRDFRQNWLNHVGSRADIQSNTQTHIHTHTGTFSSILTYLVRIKPFNKPNESYFATFNIIQSNSYFNSFNCLKVSNKLNPKVLKEKRLDNYVPP